MPVFEPTDSPIFLQTLRSLQMPIRAMLNNEKLPVTLAYGSSGETPMGLLTGKEAYPLLFLRVSTIGPNPDSPYQNGTAQRRGIPGGLSGDSVSEDGNYRTFFRLVPVRVTLEVTYYTKDAADLMGFINLWVMNKRRLNFYVKVLKTTFPIQVRPELDISVPPVDTSKDEGIFPLVTSITVDTYIGDLIRVPVLSKAKVRILTMDQARAEVGAGAREVLPPDVLSFDFSDLTV